MRWPEIASITLDSSQENDGGQSGKRVMCWGETYFIPTRR
jgi:hypothetical protein